MKTLQEGVLLLKKKTGEKNLFQCCCFFITHLHVLASYLLLSAYPTGFFCTPVPKCQPSIRLCLQSVWFVRFSVEKRFELLQVLLFLWFFFGGGGFHYGSRRLCFSLCLNLEDSIYFSESLMTHSLTGFNHSTKVLLYMQRFLLLLTGFRGQQVMVRGNDVEIWCWRKGWGCEGAMTAVTQ